MEFRIWTTHARSARLFSRDFRRLTNLTFDGDGCLGLRWSFLLDSPPFYNSHSCKTCFEQKSKRSKAIDIIITLIMYNQDKQWSESKRNKYRATWWVIELLLYVQTHLRLCVRTLGRSLCLRRWEVEPKRRWCSTGCICSSWLGQDPDLKVNTHLHAQALCYCNRTALLLSGLFGHVDAQLQILFLSLQKHSGTVQFAFSPTLKLFF